MPLNITHSFVSAIPDNPLDSALGKVTPSRWDAAHTITGNLAASDVTNVPFGIVTGTNVQSAINELEAAIPAPGPGTDPLFLTKGMDVSTINPNFNPDATNRYSARFNIFTDSSQVDPTFANQTAGEFGMYGIHGQAVNNVQTSAKQTFFALDLGCTFNAAGQKIVQNNAMHSYGMSDTAIWGDNLVMYAGGPVNGDEGQAWGLVSDLQQQNFLVITNIVSVPAPSTVNTTTTQIIFKSKTAQTVSVVNTIGIANGDWVIIDQQIPSASPNMEAVQVTAFTANSITGVFVYNHQIGVTVTPALRLIVNASFQMGQDRVLINRTKPAHTAGLATGTVGAAITGAGTGWANNMVGGNALNIGAFSFTADDYTLPPFGVGAAACKSWYQIINVSSPTDLSIFSYSVAADASYRGRGPGAGTYTIRQAARIMRILPSTGEIILENSTSTWSAGDEVECVICPYADVSGFQYHMSAWTNGGTYRRFMQILNNGARTFESCISIADGGEIGAGPDADSIGWGTAINIGTRCNVALSSVFAQQCAIQLHSAFDFAGQTDAGGFIMWGAPSSVAPGIGPNSTNLGLTFRTNLAGGSPIGDLDFAAPGAGINTDVNLSEMFWGGYIHLQSSNSLFPSYVLIDHVGGVDFERGFLRFDHPSRTFELGTEVGGAGAANNIAFFISGAERLRFVNTGGIKFSDPADFSANGVVATNLGNVGPAGANVTVQTWLTIIDNTGATRYIPCF